MLTIHWNIVFSGTPEILRYCKGCRKKQSFFSSGLFRINAQQKNLDVWLIHRCHKCDEVWNMAVHSRVNTGALQQDIYEGYLSNDPDLAKATAFNRHLLDKNRAEFNIQRSGLEIIGPEINLEILTGPVNVVLHSVYDLDIRVEKLLRYKLNISRATLKAWIKLNLIEEKGGDLIKAKFKSGMMITFLPE